MLCQQSTNTDWLPDRTLNSIEGLKTTSVKMDYESFSYGSPPIVHQYIPTPADETFSENSRGGSQSFYFIPADIQNEVDGIISNCESPLTSEQLMKQQQYTNESDFSLQETVEPKNLQDIIQLYHIDKEPFNDNDSDFMRMDGELPQSVGVIDTGSPCHSFDFGQLTLDSSPSPGTNDKRSCKTKSKRKNSPKNMTRQKNGLPSAQSKKKRLYEQDPMENKDLDKKRRDALRAKKNRDRTKNDKKELEQLLQLERQARQGLEAEVAELRRKLEAVEKAMTGKVPIKTASSVCQGQQMLVVYVPYSSSDVNTLVLTPGQM